MSKFYKHYWQRQESEQLSDYPYKWPVISKYIPQDENMTILDFGCGPGRITSELLKVNPESRIIGVDISEYAIKKISKRFPQHTFYHVEDGEKLPIRSGAVDFIAALDVIEHIYNTEFIIKEFYRVLKPKGKILISTPFYGRLKNIVVSLLAFDTVFDPFGAHIRFFTKRMLVQGLEKQGFHILNFGYFGRFYPLSNGMYVLAQKP